MAPPGLWGMKGSSLPAFGVSGERLKSRHRYRIIERSEFIKSEVWRSKHCGERQSSGSALPIKQVVRHRSVSGDDECLVGRLEYSFGM